MKLKTLTRTRSTDRIFSSTEEICRVNVQSQIRNARISMTGASKIFRMNFIFSLTPSPTYYNLIGTEARMPQRGTALEPQLHYLMPASFTSIPFTMSQSCS